MSDAVIAVGRDCPCGHPLVVRDGVEACSVYGAHRPIARPGDFGVHRRLVADSIAATDETSRARRSATWRLKAVS